MLFSSLSLQIMREFCVIAGDLKKKSSFSWFICSEFFVSWHSGSFCLPSVLLLPRFPSFSFCVFRRARGGGGKEPPDSSAPWLPNTKRTRGGAVPGARCALHHGQAVSGRNQGTACRKPRGCCAVRPVSEDRLGEVSSVLSKPVLAPQPEPEHATGLGCLAGLSYLQIVMTGTEKKKLN